ncbi:hypothetical protein FJV46_08645 [Arthrobacter agilis]|uniref:hypothetical protein n=1 Tax=Arthrobacter agilis TaxID=37921 RepID=UPI000B35C84F|nr:hypothetical protein [Arthrobacter agilis]OUM43190.1 hypothetical protein B8W74_08170 [Arthrobacter agilis]PPB47672.1 hypothetical protein CI784_00670 [Arthrobacter agilis]TPV25674.1 hypothetical protein FJV46_08645 [Arthrobacter agilis]VDR33457.1 Uncharacterised protein [Arthrobacter agilis]
MTTRNRHSTRLAIAGIVAAAGLGLAGCNTEGPEEGVDVEDISEGEIAESSPAADPEVSGVPEAAPGLGYSGLYDQNFYDEADAYVGQEVTVSAEVTENISDDTFVIAGADDTAVDPLLIVEEVEVPSLNEGEVVQLTGTVQENFDVAAAEETLGMDLEDELYADYIGEPYLSITSGEVLEEN